MRKKGEKQVRKACFLFPSFFFAVDIKKKGKILPKRSLVNFLRPQDVNSGEAEDKPGQFSTLH